MPFTAGQKFRASQANELHNNVIFNSLGGCTLTTTSATYVDIVNATTSYTKIGASSASDLIVEVSASGFSTGATTGFVIGVNINAVDTDVTFMLFSTANAHTTLPTGRARITGLAAGAYTVKLRAKRNSGAGTLTVDNGDSVCFMVSEDPT